MIFVLLIANLFALEFKLNIEKPLMKEGQLFTSEIILTSENSEEINKIINIKEKQVHKNLYLVEVNLNKNTPFGTFVATTDKKADEGFLVNIVGEFHVENNKPEQFIYEEINHRYFNLPVWAFFILIPLLGVLGLLGFKFKKKQNAKELFHSRQEKLLKLIKNGKTRSDLELVFTKRAEIEDLFEVESSKLKKYMDYLYSIQYKEHWDQDELSKCLSLHKDMIENLKHKKYGI